MMGPSHFGGGVSAESFGVDGFVRGFSFDAQSFVSLSLAFGAASAHVRSPKVTRSVGVAATLPFSLVGDVSFRVPVYVGLVLRIRITLPWCLFPGCHFLCLDVSRENAFIIATDYRPIQRIERRWSSAVRQWHPTSRGERVMRGFPNRSPNSR